MDNRRIYTHSELVNHIKYYTAVAGRIGVERLIKDDYSRVEGTNAVALADDLAYIMDAQIWINAQDEPLLDEIWEYAVQVDNDYTNREAWIKLLELAKDLE